MALQDLPLPVFTVAMLAADGMTAGEIAAALGMPLPDVIRELEPVGLTPAQLTRVEHAVLDEALPGVTWKEQRDPAGGVMRLEAERRPNMAAATLLLRTHKADVYGEAASDGLRITVDRKGYLRAQGRTDHDVIDGECEPVPGS